MPPRQSAFPRGGGVGPEVECRQPPNSNGLMWLSQQNSTLGRRTGPADALMSQVSKASEPGFHVPRKPRLQTANLQS